MGRRSINTTKSGKYMNPTDQARKEARKKELKKNKKQRQIVRTAVLKGKDPMQLLAEMEKIDQMEYNVMQPSPLNEKVLKDKRKKLKDTFDRVMKMYYKDDRQRWEDIRRAETEYQKRRNHMLQYYEAVKHAQEVNVDEIPLPLPKTGTESYGAFGISVPMPNDYGIMPMPFNTTLPPPPGILRKKSAYSPPHPSTKVSRRNKIPPGVPPGPPPVLSDEEDEGFESDSEDTKMKSESESDKRDRKKKVIRFADKDSSDSEDEKKKAKSSSGQDIDSFMREMEEVHKKRKADPGLGNSSDSIEDRKNPTTASHAPSISSAPPLGMPPPLMFRPPPMMMGRLPPGPPPGRPPVLPPGSAGLPPRMNAGMRLPPGPPLGMTPSMMRYSNNSMAGTPNVLSAAPQLINRMGDDHSTDESQSTKSSATIEAKAQMRNLNADVTRFVPVSLRVKREDMRPKPKADKKEIIFLDPNRSLLNKHIPNAAPATSQPSKDDAYSQFMKEMQGLL